MNSQSKTKTKEGQMMTPLHRSTRTKEIRKSIWGHLINHSIEHRTFLFCMNFIWKRTRAFFHCLLGEEKRSKNSVNKMSERFVAVAIGNVAHIHMNTFMSFMYLLPCLGARVESVFGHFDHTIIYWLSKSRSFLLCFRRTHTHWPKESLIIFHIKYECVWIILTSRLITHSVP